MAFPMDLRVRVLAAIYDGLSCRAAAVRFGIAPSPRSAGSNSTVRPASFAPRLRTH